MPIYPSEHDPPEETIFAALGRLVYAFAELEASLLHALVTALGDTDQARVVIAGLSFNQALDRFSVVYAELADADGACTLKELCSTMSTLNEERNRHIHASWGFWGTGQPMRARQRLRRNEGLGFSMETVEAEEVLRLAERMSEVAENIYDLRRRYMDHRRKASRFAVPTTPS